MEIYIIAIFLATVVCFIIEYRQRIIEKILNRPHEQRYIIHQREIKKPFKRKYFAGGIVTCLILVIAILFFVLNGDNKDDINAVAKEKIISTPNQKKVIKDSYLEDDKNIIEKKNVAIDKGKKERKHVAEIETVPKQKEKNQKEIKRIAVRERSRPIEIFINKNQFLTKKEKKQIKPEISRFETSSNVEKTVENKKLKKIEPALNNKEVSLKNTFEINKQNRNAKYQISGTKQFISESNKNKKKIKNQISKLKSIFPYTIQIGSYQNIKKASEIASWLKGKGDHAFTSYLNKTKNRNKYQVFIGYYKTLNEAKKMALKLKKRRFRMVNIVKRDFAVQVDKSNSNKKIENILYDLKLKNHVAYEIPDRENQKMVRILVGAFSNENTAEGTLLNLFEEGFFPEVVLR